MKEKIEEAALLCLAENEYDNINVLQLFGLQNDVYVGGSIEIYHKPCGHTDTVIFRQGIYENTINDCINDYCSECRRKMNNTVEFVKSYIEWLYVDVKTDSYGRKSILQSGDYREFFKSDINLDKFVKQNYSASPLRLMGAIDSYIAKNPRTYYDENGDTENTDKTQIIWYRVNGSAKSKIGTGVTYAVSSADAGYSIKCEVTPYTDTLPNEGETVSSAAVSVKKSKSSNSSSSTGGSTSGISVSKDLDTLAGILNNQYANNSTFVPIPEEKETSFIDTKNHWASDYIEKLYAKGLVNGRDGGKFEPDAPITRAEWLTLLVRGAQIDTNDVKWQNCFFDVDKDEWYALDIQAAFDLGLISGDSDGRFSPDEYITREAMAKMLVDVYEYIIGSDMDDSSARSFADNDTISAWADVYVKKASASGLINGDDKGCFNPKNDTTRAEASAVLSRMLEMTEED